jgi:hypothetical protein
METYESTKKDGGLQFMLGDSVIRIGTYTIALFSLFFLFGEILSSAIDIALAFKSGIILPLITVAVAAITFTQFTAKSLREPNETRFLSIFAWILTGYLSLISALTVIAYGFGASFAIAAAIFITMYFIRAPIETNFNLSRFCESAKETIQLAFHGTSVKRWGKWAYQNLMTITFPDESLEDIIEVVSDYPELNLLVIRYESLYVLIIPKTEMNRVYEILRENEIRNFEKGSELLTWAILYQMPVIFEENGLRSSDYRIAYDLKSVDRVISSWPIGATLFSTHTGLSIVLRKSDEFDGYTNELPSGYEIRIIAGKDYSVFKNDKQWGIS